jgi:hypothetical protein
LSNMFNRNGEGKQVFLNLGLKGKDSVFPLKHMLATGFFRCCLLS